ncbi:hypothetical protein ACFVXC_24475 [Streptomyces sp. NPDC058257]|uniref:hypothetical protein n=1 Tax=Streptomyces sp. NPDC058257 TaxID=3346409 RepID=UPI0036EEAD18
MTTRRARRTARSAALAVVAAAAAFSLTACGGSGDGAAGTAKKDSAASYSTGNGGVVTVNGSKTGAGTYQADDVVSVSDSSKAASTYRTQKLVDGSTAKIYKLGGQHYRADIVSDGQVVGGLEANGEDTGVDANGMFVVLTLDGKVHSWMGGEHQGPGTFKVAGGWTVKVTKVGELHYRAEILGNEGAVEGTLEADQQDDGAVANGVYIVLSAGGEISAHE